MTETEQTQRNISIDSNTWTRLKKEAARRNKNVRDFAGEILIDYLKGPPTKSNVKAIIIAAGMSSRLIELTDEIPKCMLDVGGKTLLQRQIEIFKQCGIDDIVVIRGYKKEKINYTGVKYVYNMNYRRNNIFESLMAAESEMTGEFIASYSDILFNKEVVEALLKSGDDLSVVVDSDWKKSYQDRFQHPMEEAENVIIKNGKVVKIAKTISPNEASAEFIGMMKFSAKGANILKDSYTALKSKLSSNTPFHTAATLERAYMTDIFQELINQGHVVRPVIINGGWMELDTEEDFQKAVKLFK
jgi:phosphoenolpyruvate phosphomutase